MTYSDLLAQIATWTVRDDLEDLIPQFITMAEDRFNRNLRVPQMEDESTSTVEAITVTLPTDFQELIAVYIGPDQAVIEQIGVAALRRCWLTTDTGEPQAFALQSAREMMFGPTPDQEYDVVINYYAKIPALTEATPENWLLDEHPDLYLAGALAAAFAYMVDAERGRYWDAQTQQKLAEINMLGTRMGNSAALQTISPGW